MSSSIAIPKRRAHRTGGYGIAHAQASASSSSSPGCSTPASGSTHRPSASSSYAISSTSGSPRTPAIRSMASPVLPMDDSMYSGGGRKTHADRRPSLLGTSLSHSEYTVVNVGGPDGPPRLVTCVKSSQGFDWNQGIFLSSHLDYDSTDLEIKADPVEEIVLTDEEAAALLPQ